MLHAGRGRWQAKKWRAKGSNRRTAEQNREGGARRSRNFTSSEGFFVNPRFRTDMFRFLMSMMLMMKKEDVKVMMMMTMMMMIP